MNYPNIKIIPDDDEPAVTINIDNGGVGIVIHCYTDEDDKTRIIDILEKIEGHTPRRLAFISENKEIKIYGL